MAFSHNSVKPRHAVCRIMSKVYHASLKWLTSCLKRSEKFVFSIIFLNYILNLAEFMIQIALLKGLGGLECVTIIEVINMRSHSSKANVLRYICAEGLLN